MQTTIKKTFNAVAESRQWREKTGRLLASMSSKERIEFLNRRISDFPETRERPANLSSLAKIQ